jgi:hypothetical protein
MAITSFKLFGKYLLVSEPRAVVTFHILNPKEKDKENAFIQYL